MFTLDLNFIGSWTWLQCWSWNMLISIDLFWVVISLLCYHFNFYFSYCHFKTFQISYQSVSLNNTPLNWQTIIFVSKFLSLLFICFVNFYKIFNWKINKSLFFNFIILIGIFYYSINFEFQRRDYFFENLSTYQTFISNHNSILSGLSSKNYSSWWNDLCPWQKRSSWENSNR